MSRTYSSFDLNIAPEQGNRTGEAKYYHQEGGWRVPVGIFPPGGGRAKIWIPHMHLKGQATLGKERTSTIAWMDWDNNRSMIIEEFARKYDDITEETRMIANCLNLA